MSNSKTLKILRRTLVTILLVITAIVVFILTFDWNRARPFINQKVSESIGREFTIHGDLKVHFTQGLKTEASWRRYVPRPEISAEDIEITNPDWSTVGKQMTHVQRVVVALHPLPLLDKHVVLTDLSIDTPLIALQRRKDGNNTWTLKDNGPSTWSVEIEHLSFNDGSLRYVDDGIGMDLRVKASTIAASDGVPSDIGNTSSVQKYGLQFVLGGTYHQAPITGNGKAGAVLSLENQNTVYPVQANAQLGQNKIGIHGTLTDPRSPTGIDLQLTLGGASMADLYPLTGVLLPETPAYATHGRLFGKKNGDNWNWIYQNFSGTVGSSDLSGTLEYATRQPRPLLSGAVKSQQLRLEDLGPSVGADSNVEKKAHGRPAVQPDDKALPVEQFDTTRWDALDADVKFSGKRLIRTHDIPLENIVAEIHMKDKVLSLTPLDFGMAGGDVTSNISLDGRKKSIDAQIKMAARHLKIRELFPNLQSMQASFGEINSDAALTGHGNSISSMLATSNGEFGATISQGTVSELILETAGLNLANMVFVKLFGDKQVHLNCMGSDFSVKNGRAAARRFVLDTDDAVVDVTGDIDLAQEALDLDIRPKSKGARIFSLRTPLYAKGTFEHPDVGPYKGPLIIKTGAAVLLATASPVAAILPLVNLNKAPDVDCPAVLAQTMQTRTAPKSEATAAPAKPVTEKQIQHIKQEK